MASWTEIKRYLLSRYKVEEPSPTQLALTFSYADDRSQLIAIDLFEALERQWICLRTRVCQLGNLAPSEALVRNRQLVVGHLCLERDTYLLKSNHLLSGLDENELELSMHVLARTADELEAALEAGADRF